MNTNCLLGFRCPHCGSEGPFDIQVTVWRRLYDDGTDDTENGDTEWDGDSPCECAECRVTGLVRTFCPDTEESE